ADDNLARLAGDVLRHEKPALWDRPFRPAGGRAAAVRHGTRAHSQRGRGRNQGEEAAAPVEPTRGRGALRKGGGGWLNGGGATTCRRAAVATTRPGLPRGTGAALSPRPGENKAPRPGRGRRPRPARA